MSVGDDGSHLLTNGQIGSHLQTNGQMWTIISYISHTPQECMLCTTHLEHHHICTNTHFIVVCLCNGLAQNEFIYST